MKKTLVDSSAWIETLRPGGNPQVSERVARLLSLGDACWCDMVRLELWRGVKGREERAVLQDLDTNLVCLETPGTVWKSAVQLMRKAQSNGLNVPPPDVIIVSVARHHKVNIEHSDRHIEELLKLV